MIRGFFVLDESDVPRHQIRFHPCRTAGIPRNRKLGCLVELIREPARQAGKTASFCGCVTASIRVSSSG